jgi:hypothetical protein
MARVSEDKVDKLTAGCAKQDDGLNADATGEPPTPRRLFRARSDGQDAASEKHTAEGKDGNERIGSATICQRRNPPQDSHGVAEGVGPEEHPGQTHPLKDQEGLNHAAKRPRVGRLYPAGATGNEALDR